MQTSVSAHAPPASRCRRREPGGPAAGGRSWNCGSASSRCRSTSILGALLAGFTYTGDIKGEVSVMIAVLVVGGFTCAEIGKRMPVLRNIGAGGDLRDLHPVRAGLLQAAARR